MCQYLYRIRAIKFENGEYPKNGFIRLVNCNYSTEYSKIIAYNRRLIKKELRDYTLDFIGTMW